MLKGFILMFLLSGLISQSAIADELTTAKVSDIRRLMRVYGSGNITEQFANATLQQMFEILKVSRTEIPDRALAVMQREAMTFLSEKLSASDGLTDEFIPIYDKYFTHQDIRELLAFYQTPVGKKSILLTPKLFNEGMMVGQRWGQSIAPELTKRLMNALRREGLLPKGQ